VYQRKLGERVECHKGRGGIRRPWKLTKAGKIIRTLRKRNLRKTPKDMVKVIVGVLRSSHKGIDTIPALKTGGRTF